MHLPKLPTWPLFLRISLISPGSFSLADSNWNHIGKGILRPTVPSFSSRRPQECMEEISSWQQTTRHNTGEATFAEYMSRWTHTSTSGRGEAATPPHSLVQTGKNTLNFWWLRGRIWFGDFLRERPQLIPKTEWFSKLWKRRTRNKECSLQNALLCQPP